MYTWGGVFPVMTVWYGKVYFATCIAEKIICSRSVKNDIFGPFFPDQSNIKSLFFLFQEILKSGQLQKLSRKGPQLRTFILVNIFEFTMKCLFCKVLFSLSKVTHVNLFLAIVPILYPMKTLENQRCAEVSQGV